MTLQDRYLAWGPEYRGSSRPVALLRIAIILIAWGRLAGQFGFFRATSLAEIVLGAVFFAASALALVGLWTRAALAVTAAAIFTAYAVLGSELGRMEWLAHHVYLLAAVCLILSLTPCDRSYSVDRYLAVRRARADGQLVPAEDGPLWATRLIGLQLSAIYFWAAIDKTDFAWISGQRLEQTMVVIHTGRALEPVMLWMPALVAGSIAVLMIEYILPFAIHSPRRRKVWIPLALALHAVFYVFLPVKTYSITMIALYLVMIPPGTVHRILDDLQGQGSGARPSPG